jgi:acyl-CoA reductase-like NAD-dependent aldehyde dehydrogenase
MQSELLKSINPANGELIAEYPETSPEDLEGRLAKAEEAFSRWRKTAFAERAKRFSSLAELLRKQQPVLAELMTREMGKPIAQAEAEIEKCAWVCDYYTEEGERLLAPQEVETDANRSYVRYDPLGTILAIMPWNFPYWQAFRAAVPAIAGGNVMVLKHAGNVSGVALKIEDLFREADFPEGVFTTVLLSRKRTEELIESPKIHGVTLTGSERAGRSVGASAGEQIKPTVLELGGSDPFIILADAEFSKVVPQAVKARVQNTGQSCIAAKRFLVDSKLAKPFEEAFRNEMQKLKVGDPLQRETEVGPLAREDLRDQLHKQVESTIEKGGRLCCGGRVIDGKGFFYEPTILADVAPGMAAFDEETFGPVAAIVTYQHIDEAIRLSNASPYGLGASIWTSNPDAATPWIPQIEAGAVFVNEIVKSDPRIPFGGVKHSGYGRELGREGLLAFMNKKTVWFG